MHQIMEILKNLKVFFPKKISSFFIYENYTLSIDFYERKGPRVVQVTHDPAPLGKSFAGFSTPHPGAYNPPHAAQLRHAIRGRGLI